MACSAKSLYQGLGKDEVDLRDIAWQIRESEVVSQLMELPDTNLVEILKNDTKLNALSVSAFQKIGKTMKNNGNGKTLSESEKTKTLEANKSQNSFMKQQ